MRMFLCTYGAIFIQTTIQDNATKKNNAVAGICPEEPSLTD